MEQNGLEESLSRSMAASVEAGLVLPNRRRANGTYDGEVRRLGIRSRKMAYGPCDSRRKDKLITGCCIPIDIHERERERERERMK